MPDKDLITITLSRMIPAPKWRVIRLLTRVWEFPKYVPGIKEARVLSKSRRSIVSKWRVQVDEVPISWVEHDILALEENKISFRAVEGDLDEFGGEWTFEKRPEGTEVTVNVYLRVGVPAIKDFAGSYIQQILTKNFESILRALERRLISLRYAEYKQGDTQKLAGFGIIGHLYNFEHLIRCLKMLDPGFKMPSQEFLGQLFNVTPSFKLFDILDFKSKAGESANGCLVVATFIPEMIEKDIWTIFSKVVKACKIAEKYGVGVVTLGGFTSIVGERIGQEIAREVDVAVTTGNTFTAAMAVDGVLKAANLLNLAPASLNTAIIGGTGDIGSGCARVLADKVKQLTITGRTKENLKRLSIELSKKHKAKIEATTDNEKAVKDADIVISVASATAPILQIDWFKPGAL